MNSVETVTGKIKVIASNKGHVRLFLVASIIWMAVAGPLSWESLPRFEPLGDQSYRCRPDLTKKFSEDTAFEACMDREIPRVAAENAKLEANVEIARFLQVGKWLSIVLFVPVILPLMLIFGAIILQWISDGYGNKSSTDPK